MLRILRFLASGRPQCHLRSPTHIKLLRCHLQWGKGRIQTRHGDDGSKHYPWDWWGCSALPHWRCFSDNIGILITRDSIAWQSERNGLALARSENKRPMPFVCVKLSGLDSELLTSKQEIANAIFVLTASGHENQFIYPWSQQPSRPFLLLRRQSPDDAREARPLLALVRPILFSHQNAVVLLMLPSIVSSESEFIS